MKRAYDTQNLIEECKDILEAEDVDIDDYDECIHVLEHRDNAPFWIEIYTQYINY